MGIDIPVRPSKDVLGSQAKTMLRSVTSSSREMDPLHRVQEETDPFHRVQEETDPLHRVQEKRIRYIEFKRNGFRKGSNPTLEPLHPTPP